MKDARALILALMIILSSGASALAQDRADTVLDINRAIAVVTERFEGQIVAAEIADGRPHERVPLVFDFRLLTPQGAILRIRVDPFAWVIVDVDGYGLVDARRQGNGS
ncbi:hypothetical protein [Pelagibacterium luteolum]|uniref:Peptidase propeptide and YPEB domain-containing protein n=1 Tax=Pelagibacterium luteolum TaxID=440168 RepID=A0A1G7RQ85_9HYPH|nr:hypothetical protein [Pelagibacterium luteolum]SDG12823.1 hypothetical protein SAMN04487974_10145 [Pelagibacterium luteolum]